MASLEGRLVRPLPVLEHSPSGAAKHKNHLWPKQREDHLYQQLPALTEVGSKRTVPSSRAGEALGQVAKCNVLPGIGGIHNLWAALTSQQAIQLIKELPTTFPVASLHVAERFAGERTSDNGVVGPPSLPVVGLAK